jgi:hypothetical protein
LKFKVKLQFYLNNSSFQLTEIKMSFITSSAYPRQMTVTNTFLWKTVDNQCLGTSTGADACAGIGADQYEAVDRAFESNFFLK